MLTDCIVKLEQDDINRLGSSLKEHMIHKMCFSTMKQVDKLSNIYGNARDVPLIVTLFMEEVGDFNESIMEFFKLSSEIKMIQKRYNESYATGDAEKSPQRIENILKEQHAKQEQLEVIFKNAMRQAARLTETECSDKVSILLEDYILDGLGPLNEVLNEVAKNNSEFWGFVTQQCKDVTDLELLLLEARKKYNVSNTSTLPIDDALVGVFQFKGISFCSSYKYII